MSGAIGNFWRISIEHGFGVFFIFPIDDTDDKCQHLEKRNNPETPGLDSIKAMLLMPAPEKRVWVRE